MVALKRAVLNGSIKSLELFLPRRNLFFFYKFLILHGCRSRSKNLRGFKIPCGRKILRILIFAIFAFFSTIRKNKFPRKKFPQKNCSTGEIIHTNITYTNITFCHLLIKTSLSFRNKPRGIFIKWCRSFCSQLSERSATPGRNLIVIK